MAYISSPDRLEYALPHSDSTDDKIRILYRSNTPDVVIQAVDRILIDIDDLEWFIDKLSEVKSVCKDARANSK